MIRLTTDLLPKPTVFSLRLFPAIFMLMLTVSAMGQTSRESLSRTIDSAQTIVDSRQSDALVLPIINDIRRKASAQNLNYELAASYLLESDHYFANSNWEKAIAAGRKAFEIGKKIKDRRERTEIQIKGLNAVGYVFSYQSDFAEALATRLKALAIADSGYVSKKDMGDLLSWIADDYRHLDQFGKAVDYLEKSKPYLKEMSGEGVVDHYYTYCQSLAALGEGKRARAKLSELDAFIASASMTDAERNGGYLQSTKLHGEFAMADKEFDQAAKHYERYLHYAKLLEIDVHVAIALNKIARAHLASGNKKSALEFFLKSYDECLVVGDIDYAFKNANAIAEIYAGDKNYAEAFRYSQMAFKLKDSLNSTERVTELNFLEAKYQDEKKREEIAELRLSNTQRELDVIKTNRRSVIGGIAAAAVIILLGLLYRNSRQKTIIAEKEKSAIEQQQQVLSLQAMINGQETERSRIAKDLHDSMGGTFSTVKMYLSTLEHELSDEKQVQLLEKSISAIGTAAADIREIAHNMMPEALTKLGLIQAVQELSDRISNTKKLQIVFQHFGVTDRLQPAYEITIYRIIQELLNNILKHADASQAIIQFIREDDRLSITIEDNGKGFAAEGASGFGLQSVRERVQSLKGTLNIDSQPAVGTTIMMEILL